MSDKKQRKQYIRFILNNLFSSELLEDVAYKTFEEFCKEQEK